MNSPPSINASRIWLLKLILIAAVVSVSPLKWNDEFFIRHPKGEAVLQWSFACDFTGFDIDTISPTSDIGQCGQLCVNNAECTHITWNSGTCYLKRITSPVSPRDFSTCTSGWINRLRQDVRPTVDRSVNCFYNGKDITTTTLATSDLCRDSCINNRLCIHFAWLDTFCYVMLSDSSLTAADLNAVMCGRITKRSN